MDRSRFIERLVRKQDAILKEKDFVKATYSRLSFQPGAYRRRSNRMRVSDMEQGTGAEGGTVPGIPSAINTALGPDC